MSTLQSLIDAAAKVAIPEYQEVCAEKWRIESRDHASRAAMEDACKALARAVRRRFGTKQEYAKGKPSIHYEVSAYPLVNHSDRPMTWTPHLKINAHVVIWTPTRMDYRLEFDVLPRDEAAVLEGISNVKAAVKMLTEDRP